MSVELTGRIAIVTGAAQGIGAATARKLAERGAHVIGVDVQADALTQVAVEIGGKAVVHDITDAAGDQQLVDDVIQEFGKVDILANVAGGVLDAARGIEDLTLEDWHKVIALNMHAPLYLAKAVAPGMKAQRSGRIIAVGSGAGRSHSRTGVIPYAAGKAGLMGIIRQLAVELAPYGITCNVVSPGLILSERGRVDWESKSPERQAREMETVAIGRTGEPREIADVIAFIASDEASYIVGQTIMVDGGHWMF
jgi:3-oxoacyl-[acyl-carrier protein] reductase